MRPILVLNAGSSSVKYALFDQPTRQLASGVVERIGEPGSPVADHAAAVRQILDAPDVAAARPVAVGHRVVHGGTRFREPVLVDDTVLATIEALTPLAPLHNPANLAGIRVARELLPQVPQVAVFDTAFHSTLPPAAYTYALSAEAAERYGVRRYGFHGISVRYVAAATARLLDRDPATLNLIVLHLGNGASATAVAGGRSVETSMGLTPLEGLVMGTRSGSVDPGLLLWLLEQGEMPVRELAHALEHESGLRGLAGSADMREVLGRAATGDERAQLALEVYVLRLRAGIAAMAAALGGLDALAFTGGVGENAPEIRARAVDGLGFLGLAIDGSHNGTAGDADCSAPGARARTVVLRAREDLEIARQVRAVLA